MYYRTTIFKIICIHYLTAIPLFVFANSQSFTCISIFLEYKRLQLVFQSCIELRGRVRVVAIIFFFWKNESVIAFI